MADHNEFENAYTDTGFWQKLKRYALLAGREVVEKALLLYYAMQEEAAPAWAKATIAGALGYFIVPLDAIADFTPAAGYADDLGVLVLAVAAVSRYINDDVRQKTQRRLEQWFGTDDATADDAAADALARQTATTLKEDE
mgnify:CR=1 FL=1|tara:strand:- start:92223 stop:92642 length:420 start_codon:yes stop_codon:yes gene_type:complete